MKNFIKKRYFLAFPLMVGILLLFALIFSSCDTVSEVTISVVSIFPENDSVDIPIDAVISATLSDPIDESTLIEGSFTLSGPEGNVNGTISYNEIDLTITFTPDRDLYLFRTYTATISGQIQDSEGNSLEGEFSWSFMTRQGIWGQIQQISSETSRFPASLPQVAAESFSDGVAVWEDYKPDSLDSYFTYTSRFEDNSDTWSSDTFFDDGGFENLANNITPQVAVDDNGKAVAVWSRLTPSEVAFRKIYSATFIDNSWNTPEAISPDEVVINFGNDATDPQIALDPSGNGFAVWVQELFGGEEIDVYANRLSNDIWGTSGPISVESLNVNSPQVATDATGNVVSVWAESVFDGFYSYYDRILSNRFTNNTWQMVTPVSLDNLEKGNIFNATSPQIALDPSGKGYSVYRDVLSPDSNYRIFAAKFNGTGWEQPVAISPSNTVLGGSFNAFTPQIGIDDNGNAFAVWHQETSLGPSIYVNTNSSSGWGTPEQLSPPDSVEEPRIAVNAFGDAIAIWLDGDGEVKKKTVVARRFDKITDQWFDKEDVSDGLSNALYPDIAISDDGTAIVVWVQDGNVFANRLE